MTSVCPSCEGAESRALGERVTTRPFQVVRCSACRLVYASPRPTPEELDEFYGQDYFEGASKRYDNYESCGEHNARRMWDVLNGWYDLEQAPNRRLLDVGTATGGFLAEAMDAGWDVEGVELADSAAATARSKGLRVHTGDIDHPSLSDGYGLISMWHVVEHLIDPPKVLDRVVSRMGVGGLLLIELPNWNSVGRLARGMDWSALTPPEHINFFTPRTLRTLVERSGLEVLKVQTPPHRFPTRPVQTRILLNGVGSVLGAAGLGGYLRLIARRI